MAMDVQVSCRGKMLERDDVSRMGRDEESIKKYIRGQEVEDKRLDQLELFKDAFKRTVPGEINLYPYPYRLVPCFYRFNKGVIYLVKLHSKFSPVMDDGVSNALGGVLVNRRFTKTPYSGNARDGIS
jgi:hypothetical protein